MKRIGLVCLLAAAVAAPALAEGPNTEERGSVVVWPEVRVSWDNVGAGAGDRYVDTIVELVNDTNVEVLVKLYLVNGDCQSIAPGIPPPGYVPPGFAPPATFEPGCVALNCQFLLTPHEPIYWSVYLGRKIAPSGGVSLHQGDICPRFDLLDGDGRADTELDPGGGLGLRRLRGYLVAIAVNPVDGQEIDHDFLSGTATVINYNNHSAYQYKAYVYEAIAVVPDGVINMDDVEYSANWDQLLFQFFASGSAAYGADTTPAGADGPNALNGRLSLLPVKIDVTNNVGEFINNFPFVTRATLTAWNENETARTVIQRCICCWDSGLFSNYSPLTNFLTIAGLGTDHGKARVDARANANCGRGADPNASPPDPGLPTADAPLVGVKSQQASWTIGGEAFISTDGSELSGFGNDTTGFIRYTPTAVLRDVDGNIINEIPRPIGPNPALPTMSVPVTKSKK